MKLEDEILRSIEAFTFIKGAADVEKDLGLKTDYHGRILDEKARKIIGKLLREGKIYSPKPGYLGVTEYSEEFQTD